MVKEVQKLSDGNYRVAQNDHGAPFVQFLDPKVQDWLNVSTAPKTHWRSVEAELVLQASRAKRLEEQIATLQAEKDALQIQAASLGTDLKEARAEVKFLAALSKAEKYGESFMQWRLPS